jgi:ubiquinone/menaquinone biosynthesis C-methylase UbiE
VPVNFKGNRGHDSEGPLLQFADASFQAVVDKGGLDALMGEDSSEGSEAGRKLLAEVSRVLAQGGVYLCVTLAQSHVLSAPPLNHSPALPFFEVWPSKCTNLQLSLRVAFCNASAMQACL